MRRRALLIGSQTGALRGVLADVDMMDDALRALGFETATLAGEAATYAGIVEAYRGLATDSSENDAAVVYYSGHGGRYRNPNARDDPALPVWLQYIVPTDYDVHDGAFRGILAEQLSLLQWELTCRTLNVTTILDCCHSARMSRDVRLLPKAREHQGGFPWESVVARWTEIREQARAREVDLDSNPHAVRLVACAPDQSAYEFAETDLGGPHGALTAALVPFLRRAPTLRLTWRQVIDALRPAVMDAVMMQRPELEGPSDRYLFALETRHAVGVLPVIVEGGAVYLEGAALLGLGEGDTYALVAPGGDLTAPLGTATVGTLAGDRARLLLEGLSVTDLPVQVEAHPLTVALGRRPVTVRPPDHPQHARVVDALSGSPHVRIVDAEEAAPALLAVVALEGDGVLLCDAQGDPLSSQAREVTDASLRLLEHDLLQLARAAHLRDLPSGSGPAALPSDVVLDVVRLTPDGEIPLEASGESLFEGDEIVVRLRNTSPTEERFVSVLDVGLRGAISLLTTSQPSGVSIASGDTYELYRTAAGLSGIELYWPDGQPREGSRPESLVAVVTDRPEDLTRLVQPGVSRTMRSTPSLLGTLLDEVDTGTRDARRRDETRDVTRYRILRFDFLLHPTARTNTEEPVFEIDERPDSSLRLLVPRSAEAPPGAVAVRLVEVVVHSNRALLRSTVRIDTLVVTRVGEGNEPYRAATTRFDRVRDGDRLPLDNLLVYDGPVADFLELAVWVGRDDRRGADLGDLLAGEVGAPELQAAIATLAGLAVAAPQAAAAAAAVAAVATIVRTGARLLDAAIGKSIGVYRTSLLPHERFGAGSPATTHPPTGLLRAQDMSFAYEIVGR